MITKAVADGIMGYDSNRYRDTYTDGRVLSAFAHLAWELHLYDIWHCTSMPVPILGKGGSGTILCGALATLYPSQVKVHLIDHFTQDNIVGLYCVRSLPSRLIFIDDYVDRGRALSFVGSALIKRGKVISRAIVIDSQKKKHTVGEGDDAYDIPIFAVRHQYQRNVMESLSE